MCYTGSRLPKRGANGLGAQRPLLPRRFMPADPTVPRLRPGLYAGDYGHGMYGAWVLWEGVARGGVATHPDFDLITPSYNI